MLTARLCLALMAIPLVGWAWSPDAPSLSGGQEPPAQSVPAEPERTDRVPAADGKAAASADPAASRPIAASGRRCGWLHNPTPANWWLVDRDGQWVLGSQGREPVAGMDEMRDMTTREWVKTNGYYGYGCACMDMVVDPASGDVLRISAAKPKRLAICRRDRKLPSPDE